MQTHPSVRPETPLTEWLLRAFALLLFGMAVSNMALAWYADTTRWTLLLFVVIESYTLVLLLVARRALVRDMSALAMLATLYAVFYYVLLEPAGTRRLVPEYIGVALMVAGALCQFSAKVVLGRSFGILPAYRKHIVIAGPYRLVRHPMYLGYLIGHVGVLLASFSMQNLAVMATLYIAQAIRIQKEEAVLCNVDEYRLYQKRVRWRLLPGVF